MSLIDQYEEYGHVIIPRLLLKYYRRLDLSHAELLLILQIKSALDQGQIFPSIDDIAKAMGEDKQRIYQGVHQLIQKQLLSIGQRKNDDQQAQDYFSLYPLWRKLEELLQVEDFQDQQVEKESKEQSLFKKFEEEFGRLLTPMEIESIDHWINHDHYDVDLIELALREAVLNQAYNFKYIDRILLNWEKKNIRTAQNVKAEKEKFEHRQQSQRSSHESSSPKTRVPIYNWMDKQDQS